jgi:hypothetical protein
MAENDFATNGNDGMAMFKAHDGVLAQNGVWDITICTATKQKHT